jgi:hypothetical protein
VVLSSLTVALYSRYAAGLPFVPPELQNLRFFLVIMLDLVVYMAVPIAASWPVSPVPPVGGSTGISCLQVVTLMVLDFGRVIYLT